MSWRRASEHPSDALFGTSAGALVLPRVDDANLLLERVQWAELPSGQLTLLTDAEGGRRVRVQTEQLGWLQAFTRYD